MSADDCTRDESLGIMLSRERGIQVRSKWERYKQIADKCREGGHVVMELYHCKLLADGLMLAAQNLGQDVEEGVVEFMAGADVTWKEAAYWVHRWVKRVLEQKLGGNNPLVKKPEFHAMRCNLVVACSHQLCFLRFDEVIETADLFLQVKPAEVTEEELLVQLMKGVSRYYLGLPAAVKEFDVAVRLAQKLNCKELEAKAWFGKYLSLRKTDNWKHKEDVQYCLARYEELISQVPSSRADIEGLFWTHPRRTDHQPETEATQRLERELAEEKSPILLAEYHFSLGRLLLKQKEFLRAEESLKKAIELWRNTPVIRDTGGVYQVTAQLQMIPAFQLLQLCLVEQGKSLEALIWAERARARTFRYALINVGGYEDEFEQDDKLAEDRIMTALSGCKGSVVAVEYSFAETNLLIWVLKPGMPPTVHQVLLEDFDFPGQDENQPLLRTVESYLEELLNFMDTSRMSDKTTKSYLIKFHKILIDPIKQELTGFNTIIFIPIQALHRLPWTALIDEHQKDGEKYLLQRFATAIVPSLFALRACSQNFAKCIESPSNDEILVVANPWPLSLPNFSSLSGAEAEAAAIVKLVKTHTGLVPRVHKGADAKRETVIENLRKAKWVHMACHNIVNRASYNAGALMLASPAMTNAVATLIVRHNWWQEQEEILRHDRLPSGAQLASSTNLESLVGKPMDVMSSRDEMIRSVLSARQLTNLKLQAFAVVISACSSSEGVLVGEEGILGLARALLVAGAPAVLLSLWNTQDVETRELMTLLYKNLITGRHPDTGRPYNLALALRQATLSLIGKKGIQVRDWAVFQIYGFPEVIFPATNRHGSRLRGRSTSANNLIALGLACCCILVAILYRLNTTDVKHD